MFICVTMLFLIIWVFIYNFSGLLSEQPAEVIKAIGRPTIWCRCS